MADKKNLEKKEVAKKKSDKPSLWQKISKFFREYKSELKKISWPTLPEVIKNSLVTIAVVAVVGLFIWGVDTVLTLGREALLKTDKTSVQEITSASDVDKGAIEKIRYYNLDITTVSASDVSGADAASATDVYVITQDGKIVDGYYAFSADMVTNMLNSYAVTLPDIPAVGTSVSAADTTASSSDAE